MSAKWKKSEVRDHRQLVVTEQKIRMNRGRHGKLCVPTLIT